MNIFEKPEKKELTKILKRPENNYKELEKHVKIILDDVKIFGDKALKDYTLKFDFVEIENFEVKKEEINNAAHNLKKELIDAINLAASNIHKFHSSQISETKIIETTPGVYCWQKSIAIEKVGLYIPGGTAPLFSTVLMLAIPAKIAGCKEIILCTPPDKNGKIHPAILYSAYISGVTKIYKVGGVQAIGAMAYSTETIPKVYKIFGPGNAYVTIAKQLVSKEGIAIDLPAGPSEVAIIADESANPVFVAADMLAQAEHGFDSQSILVTTSFELAKKVEEEIDKQIIQLSRQKYAKKSLEHSAIIIVNNEEEAIDIINEYAPEHLIINTYNSEILANKVINAGSVFIGEWTPESVGDYASGTNHTLPTYGYAKAYNGVNLDSFVKKITFQKLSKEGLANIGKAIEIMAEEEQLTAHKNAVTYRLNSMK